MKDPAIKLEVPTKVLYTERMKNRKSFIIELKDIKVRQPFAPKQKVFKNKKSYSRKDFRLAFAE